MNISAVLHLLGIILCGLALSLLLPLAVAAYSGEALLPYVHTLLIALALGLPLALRRPRSRNFYAREGFTAVSLTWVVISLVGALPYYFSGAIPHFIDAFFETVSGFTTTGSTILFNIEVLPNGLLFWRSFTQWLGGMGVLVLALAILPSLGTRSSALLRAEAPGPAPTRLAPRIGETAKILYAIYLSLTALNVLALVLAGMPLFDALLHAFSTAGTGGFSSMNLSISHYGSLPIEIVTTVFMLLFGTNFAVHYMLLRRDWKGVLRGEELRFYLLFAFASMALIALNILPEYGSLSESFRHSSFQVASVMTSTAFSSTNFSQWPLFSRCLLIVLMIVGSCAGSTGGGLKCMRVVILFKAMRQEVQRFVHPHIVRPLRYNGRLLDENVRQGIVLYVIMYMATFFAAYMLLSLQGMSFETNLTAAIASLSNMGPGFEGAYESYALFSPMSKIVLCACMMLGRLEILPLFMLLTPSSWKKGG